MLFQSSRACRSPIVVAIYVAAHRLKTWSHFVPRVADQQILHILVTLIPKMYTKSHKSDVNPVFGRAQSAIRGPLGRSGPCVCWLSAVSTG
ncbi:hypothetical protein Y032_0291g1556 [Ancylostoma ceylanicum]|uniref:Uncharacterized protein n=1 Tax=Ancylostoma ceylanicum TaxID=53326 RepID=A0A016S5J2_9BILA|nr:hypothetical protein Y032_0291g1556 [Ancylostoma ceylanicum]